MCLSFVLFICSVSALYICQIHTFLFFFFKQKTAYEMRISDWSSDVCSSDLMGSMNFGLFPMLDRFKTFEHEWERQHLENSRDLIFKNTYKDIETILHQGTENGTRFELECYDISNLYNMAHFLDSVQLGRASLR